ncbi:MAG: A/G-specific adenine glycosylase [Verrucomicrobia bacterium]|nr:A/G-specific adenine glycosylase [Verrucomicrobiota bacterium]MBS0646059.1 A/G-specific adenine glycosylase [Verrucomicrobiota bacterium]
MEVFPLKALKEWFMQNRRSLPWRKEPTPYAVWVSETMLQQTQVSVVIPYFLRWMDMFPTIEALAKAPIEQVLKVWEGLGYYSRARRLHQAANYLVREHEGQLPCQAELLQRIPGIGPYTKGAILNFAFHQKAVALDGNVLRVLSRYFGIEEPIDQRRAQKIIEYKLANLLPDQEPWLISEGLIELGALVCTKQARCQQCPLLVHCEAYRQNIVAEIPFKVRQQKVERLYRRVAVIRCQNEYLVIRRPKGEIMADLYEFPYLENMKLNPIEAFSQHLKLSLDYQGPLSIQTHTFTKYRVTLEPHFFTTQEKSSRHTWVDLPQLMGLPFSSGHRRILIAIREESS